MKLDWLGVRNRMFLSIFFVLLFLPLVYSILPSVNRQNGGLVGVKNEAGWPDFSLSDFADGKWQEGVVDYVNAYIPFRKPLIRGFNTLDYYVFSHSYVLDSQVAIGRENWLYSHRGILACASQRVTQEEMEKFAARIKRVEEILVQRYHKKFLFVITPNKAQVYPEYIPAAYVPFVRMGEASDEYRFLREALQAAGVTYVDGEALTEEMTAQGIMTFAKTGIHWNGVAAGVTLNAILARWGLPTYPLPIPQITNKQQSPEDDDFLRLLNIYGRPEEYLYVSAPIQGIEGAVGEKGELILISGSFGGTLVENICARHPIFAAIDYEFYNHAGHERYVRKADYEEIGRHLDTWEFSRYYYDQLSEKRRPLGQLSDIEWKEELLSHDYILVEMNADLPFPEGKLDLPQEHVTEFLERAEKLL